MIISVPAVTTAMAFPRGSFGNFLVSDSQTFPRDGAFRARGFGYTQAADVAGITAAENASGFSVGVSIAIGVGTGVVFWLLERWVLNPLFGKPRS